MTRPGLKPGPIDPSPLSPACLKPQGYHVSHYYKDKNLNLTFEILDGMGCHSNETSLAKISFLKDFSIFFWFWTLFACTVEVKGFR